MSVHVCRCNIGRLLQGWKLQCPLRSGKVYVALGPLPINILPLLSPPPTLLYPSLLPSPLFHQPSSSPSLFCPSLLPASSLFCCHRTLSTPMSVSNAISLLKVVCVCVCAHKCICGWVRSYIGCYAWQKKVLRHTSWWCLMALLLDSVADPAEQQSFSFRLCPTRQK